VDVSALRVDRVGTTAGLEDLAPEWRALEQAGEARLPFRTWDWNWCWWAAFRESKPGVRDELALRAVRERASGKLIGVAPLMQTNRPGRGPPLVRTLRFFGADPNITELPGLVCRSQDEGLVTAAIAADLRACADEWDWMEWSSVRLDSDARAVIAASGPVHWGRETPDFVLELPPTWDQLRAGLPHNVKESLRKCYHSLERDGHEFEFRVTREREEVGPALEQFLALHAARGSLTAGVPHPDVFAAPAGRAFLRDVSRRFAERDVMRVFTLHVDGKAVAARLGFALQDTLYLYYSGYDPAWSKYSVMTTCVAEAIRHAIEERFVAVNLSTGTDVSKTRWRPEEVVYREGLQASPTVRGRLAYRAYGFARDRLGGVLAHPATRRLLGRRAG
jgi:CelD/BcsL family acetyltransferase involved in cellulose biosynthesis